MSAVIEEHHVDFVKWDQNRDVVQTVHAGRVGLGAHTRGVYAVMDELRRRHPWLEIEACASGGARVDLGVLERTDRVWASDSNDAMERLAIQRWTELLLPPELIGSHVGPEVSHTTGRHLDLDFRMAVSLFGSAGIETDVTRCTPAERDRLREWTALYKRERGLLHSGRVHHVDLGDAGLATTVVVGADRDRALARVVRTETGPRALAVPLRFRGLDRRRRYRVAPVTGLRVPKGVDVTRTPWLERGSVELSGAVLEDLGVRLPSLAPGTALVLERRRSDATTNGALHVQGPVRRSRQSSRSPACRRTSGPTSASASTPGTRDTVNTTCSPGSRDTRPSSTRALATSRSGKSDRSRTYPVAVTVTRAPSSVGSTSVVNGRRASRWSTTSARSCTRRPEDVPVTTRTSPAGPRTGRPRPAAAPAPRPPGRPSRTRSRRREHRAVEGPPLDDEVVRDRTGAGVHDDDLRAGAVLRRLHGGEDRTVGLPHRVPDGLPVPGVVDERPRDHGPVVVQLPDDHARVVGRAGPEPVHAERIACAWFSCAAQCQSSMLRGSGRCPRMPSASFRLPSCAFWCTSISWPSGRGARRAPRR